MLMGPKVSRAIGTKHCVFKNSLYLEFFLSVAISAAEPAIVAEAWTYEGVRVSTTVASHTRWRSARHGIIVRPSILLPSVRIRPGGSLIDGMPALERERCMMSLMVLCRGILPKPREQDNPWLPLASIRAYFSSTFFNLLLLLLLLLQQFYIAPLQDCQLNSCTLFPRPPSDSVHIVPKSPRSPSICHPCLEWLLACHQPG